MGWPLSSRHLPRRPALRHHVAPQHAGQFERVQVHEKLAQVLDVQSWATSATSRTCTPATPPLVVLSRAPLPKLQAYQKRMAWTVPWCSSHGSDFNYDFHATLDESATTVEYNYRTKAELLQIGDDASGEGPGLSAVGRTTGTQLAAGSGWWWRRHDEYDEETNHFGGAE
jgi:hypothetical protein